MEYSINALAKMAGISTRALRYYDEIDLLSPRRISSNDYRVYGQNEVNLLQQILFYRELGLSLDEIKRIVHAQDYDGMAALEDHLVALQKKQEQIQQLIENVTKTIAAAKGEIKMRDQEKFHGFKKNMVEENEKQYGKEVREKYGDSIVDASNAKVMNLTPEEYEAVQILSQKINETLKNACATGNPAGELAQEVCRMHKEWLGYFWKHYSPEAHSGLGNMYVEDPRFKKYYDAVGEGCAEFLRDALVIFCR